MDVASLLLGAALGLVVSITGLWFRRNWEHFDQEQTRCRLELIELARSADQARRAVRTARMRERSLVRDLRRADAIDGLFEDFGEVAEAVSEFSSRTRRLRPGSLRTACAGYGLLLRGYYSNSGDPPTDDELDSAGLIMQRLIEQSLLRTDCAHASLFALRGQRMHCPPEPYSSSLPDPRS